MHNIKNAIGVEIVDRPMSYIVKGKTKRRRAVRPKAGGELLTSFIA